MNYIGAIMGIKSVEYVKKHFRKSGQAGCLLNTVGRIDEDARALAVLKSMGIWDMDSDAFSDFQYYQKSFNEAISKLNHEELSEMDTLQLLGIADRSCTNLEYWERRVKERFCEEWNKSVISSEGIYSKERAVVSAITYPYGGKKIISASLFKPGDSLFEGSSTGVIYKLDPETLYAVSTSDANVYYNYYKDRLAPVIAWIHEDGEGWITSTFGSHDVFYKYLDYCEKIDSKKAKGEIANGEILFSNNAKPLAVLIVNKLATRDVKVAVGIALTKEIPVVEVRDGRFTEVNPIEVLVEISHS